MRQSAAVVVAAALALAVAGCRSDPPAAAKTPAPQVSTVGAAPTVTPTKAPHRKKLHHRPSAGVSTPGSRPFSYRTAAVTAADLGKSWHSGCPVAPSGLAAVTMSFWGFDHRVHTGTLVVNRSVVSPVVAAFNSMFASHFPIRRMRPIAAYGGDDNASMAADNTSAFNCRKAVSDGPPSWSMHAYGEAIDINTLENPYRLDGKVLPPAGAPYMDRSDVRRGMIVAGTAPVQAFSSVGWGWGGSWASTPDYQHFSVNGR